MKLYIKNISIVKRELENIIFKQEQKINNLESKLNQIEEENNNKGNQSKVVKKRRISVVNNLMMPQISSNKNFNANNH